MVLEVKNISKSYGKLKVLFAIIKFPNIFSKSMIYPTTNR